MMKPTLEKVQSVRKDPVQDLKIFADNPRDWLAKQQGIGLKGWLLAYADDGVIWGKLVDGKLTLARDVFEEAMRRIGSGDAPTPVSIRQKGGDPSMEGERHLPGVPAGGWG